MTKLAQNFYLICFRIGKKLTGEKKHKKSKTEKIIEKKEKGFVQEIEQLAEAKKII